MRRSWPIYIATLAGALVLLVAIGLARTQLLDLDEEEELGGLPGYAVALFMLPVLVGAHFIAMFAATPSWRRRTLYVTRLPWSAPMALLLLVVLFFGPELIALGFAAAVGQLTDEAADPSPTEVVEIVDDARPVVEPLEPGSGDADADDGDDGEQTIGSRRDRHEMALDTYGRLAMPVAGAGLLVGLIVLMRLRGHDLWRGLGFSGRRFWRNVAVGVAAYFAFRWVLLPMLDTVLRLAFELFGWSVVEHEALQEFRDLGPGLGRVSIIVAVVLGAPFFEEIVFRGVLFQTLKRHAGSAAAIGISALIFAALHPGGFVAVNIFFLALIFGFLFDVTGSIVPGIVLHFLFNGVSMLMLMLMA